MKFLKMEKYLMLSSIFLYMCSLFLPAIAVVPNHPLESGQLKYFSGLVILFLGWLAVFQGCLAWLANISFGFSIYYIIKKPRIGLFFSIATIAVAALTVTFSSSPGGPDEPDEAVASVCVGFCVWLASFATMTILAGARFERSAKVISESQGADNSLDTKD